MGDYTKEYRTCEYCGGLLDVTTAECASMRAERDRLREDNGILQANNKALRIEISGYKADFDKTEAQTIAALRAEVAYEQERNANNVAINDEQVAALWKEIDCLRRALKYCQDDKEVMQNEIDLLEAKRCDDFLPKPDKLILVDGTK